MITNTIDPKPIPHIGTHDGSFHTDEVFGCVLLKCLPEYKDSTIVRSRDPEILKLCKVVLDVGGIYDFSSLRFDHHQRDFTMTMKALSDLDYDTKLSSAGLVYHHFGRRVIAELLGCDMPTQIDIIEKIYARMYENFVHSIDAIDNGISQFDGPPRYKLSSTLNSRVQNLNPSWNQEHLFPDIQFTKAMEIVKAEFCDQLNYLRNSWFPARQIVEKAVNKRKENHPSGKVLVLDNGGGCPWKEHFFDIEKEQQLESEEIAYVCFPDSSGSWRIQAIPVSKDASFENRAALPAEWRGFRDQELSSISGIDGCIFVHMSGFIGGNKTKEGALELANKALILLGKWKPTP